MHLEELYGLGEVELSRMILDPEVLRDIELVRRILTLGISVAIQDANGGTPLHNAARNGYLEVCKLLIAEGANVDIQDGSGWTALHNAAERGYLEVCRVLVESGAMVDIGSNTNWKSVEIAYFYNRRDVAYYLERVSQQIEDIIPKSE